MDSGYFEQYVNIFYPDVGATSSTPLPGEGVFGPYTFHGAGSSHQPPRTSEADQITARMSDAIFGGPYDMYSIATSSLNPSLDTATTSFEATTLPANAYLTSTFGQVYMIGVIELPQTAMAMGEMDNDWRQATSPKIFMVIDDKGGEELELKLDNGTWLGRR